MDGKMGWGLADCNWDITVSGTRQDSGPSVRATPTSVFEEVTAVPQHVVGWGGHPKWGMPWLAAFHLSLNDLDSDDARNTADNQQAGAEEVWAQIQAMTLGTVGNSSW